jgi:hypothetical protein
LPGWTNWSPVIVIAGSPALCAGITSPSWWRAAYALIIAGEGATALGFAGAAALLLRHLRSQAAYFNRAKGD